MKTAEARGAELMCVPIKDLPPAARAAAEEACRKYGGCGDVMMEAYTEYAHKFEGLPYEPTGDQKEIERLRSELNDLRNAANAVVVAGAMGSWSDEKIADNLAECISQLADFARR